MAEQAGHAEISGWVLETRAWDAVTAGEYQRALALSRHAQAVAPPDGSAFVQATAQEARTWARLGDRAQTRHLLDRVERLAGARPVPDHPEHHYRYDPAKAHAYAATTLAWAGDPAAETVARDVIAELEREGARPRRVASAHLDLGFELLPDGQGRDQVLWRAIPLEEAVVAGAWAEIPEIAEDLERFCGRPSSARVPEVLARSWRRLLTTRAPHAARDAAHGVMETFRSRAAC